MRPCLSGTTSVAPEKKESVIELSSSPAVDTDCTLRATSRNPSTGNTARHPRGHSDTTAPPSSALRHLAGRITRPLSSSACLNRERNTALHHGDGWDHHHRYCGGHHNTPLRALQPHFPPFGGSGSWSLPPPGPPGARP